VVAPAAKLAGKDLRQLQDYGVMYYVGVDLGELQDYTAVAVLEEALYIADNIDFESWGVAVPEELQDSGWVPPSSLSPKAASGVAQVNIRLGRPPDPPLYLRHLERYPLGTRYPEVRRQLRTLLRAHPLYALRHHVRVLVDRTGVGTGQVDDLRSEGLNPIGLTLKAEGDPRWEAAGLGEINVWTAKRDLVADTQVVFQNGRLKISQTMELASVLKEELANFKAKLDKKSGHDSYSAWRERDHDDLVLAVATAVFYRERTKRLLERRNRVQGGYRVPEFVEYKGTDEFFKGEPEPFLLDPSKPSGPNPWHGLNPRR
jgi:hypothetical protein